MTPPRPSRARADALRLRFAGAILALCPLFLGCDTPPPAGAPQAATASEQIGRFGEGFVVWESNRDGDWRLWIRELDEGSPRALTVSRDGFQACCPHISPDGEWIAYLSLPETRRPGYPEEGETGTLRLVRADGSEDRLLAEPARTYFEHRAALWRDDRRLVYIRGDGTSGEIDVDTGAERALTTEPLERHGWLINRPLTHASTGRASFSLYDETARRVNERPRLGGCQPYFSHDGRWGFWMAGAGGPVNRIDLETREVSTILGKNDPRLGDGPGYIYFPMLSRDGLLFAFAASSAEHDHFRSDYEVFVAESDPRTLELIGEPVRMTSNPATDRYPDAFLAPLPLGRHFGEAPLTLELAAGEGRGWRWSFGDGTTATGASGEHTWERPGRYRVQAEREGRRLDGLVIVAPAAPPRVVAAETRAAGGEILLRFDEAIATAAAGELGAKLDSGVEVVEIAAEGESALRLTLAERLRSPDRLRLAGVVDRTPAANRAGTLEIDIDGPSWPAERDSLVYVWESGDAPNLVTGVDGVERSTTAVPSGAALLDHELRMALGRGAFRAPDEQAARVRSRLQAANEMALEAVLTPAARATKPAAVVSFGGGGRLGRNFHVTQAGDRLFFGVQAGRRSPGREPQVEIARLRPGTTVHLALSYVPGRLTVWLDGEPALETSEIQGDFYHWRDRALVFGDAERGGAPWAGTLEGVAIYERALDGETVRESALRHRELRRTRPPLAAFTVEARFVDRSEPPSLEEISPYREALAVSVVEVVKKITGDATVPPGTHLRVAEWVLLDGKLVAGLPRSGEARRLLLAPFADNPQLESVYLADSLGPPTGALFYALPAWAYAPGSLGEERP